MKAIYVKMSFEKNGMKQKYWQFTPDSLGKINDKITQTCIVLDNFAIDISHLL